MYVPHFIYPFICVWTLGLLPLSAIMNNAAINIGIKVSIWIPAFISLGYIPRSWIDRSYGNCMHNFLKNHQTVLHRRYSILYFHQQCARVPISPLPHQLLFSVCLFLILVILTDVKWYLILVLICISLMTRDVACEGFKCFDQTIINFPRAALIFTCHSFSSYWKSKLFS